MLPVMNVVLLMMVFLLLTGRLAGQPGAVAATDADRLPQSHQALEARVEGRVLRLDERGQLWGDGARIEAAELTAWLAELPAGPDVILEADAGVSAPVVMAVLRQMQVAGHRRVHLRVRAR